MKCNKAHKWIALYREGELESGLQQKLREHLSHCESCRQLCQAYKQNDQVAALIRSVDPEPDNKEILTGRIINAVSALKKTADETDVMAKFGRMLDVIMLPMTRRVALACILLITVSFGYQQYYIYTKVTRLENQLSAAGKTYLAKAGKDDAEDCMRKSTRYLLRNKAGQGETEKNLRKYFRENPDKMELYISLLCNRQYRSLNKYVNQDNFMMQEIIPFYIPETE